MRILINGLNFAPELTGIGKYTGEMAQYLAENGHSVRMVTSPPYYPYWKVQKPYRSWRYQKETWKEVDIYRCPLWVPKRPTGLTRLLHLSSFMLTSFPIVLWQKKWRPDVIVTIAPSLFSAISSLTLSKVTGAKAWLHIQDFELDAAFGLGLLRGGKKMFELACQMESSLFKSFGRVSTISNRMVERLYQKGVEKERVVLFPNWVDTELIKPLSQSSKFRYEWGIRDDQVVVLYAGNMGRKQGLDVLAEVARSLADESHILFVFCGEGAAQEKLRDDTHNLDNVRMYPLQPFERLNDLLNLADIHVLPQQADAADLVMPSKLSGMLASGKPVVATALRGSELGKIVAEVGILAPPGDFRELASVLRALSIDEDYRSALGNKARDWVVGNWSKNRVLGDFEKYLQGMIKS